MNPASFTLRFLVTLGLVAIAGLVAWQLWIYYMQDPWTRDGRVRADTVALAPDVSGPVVQVFVHDNEMVHIGEPAISDRPGALHPRDPAGPGGGHAHPCCDGGCAAHRTALFRTLQQCRLRPVAR